MALGYPLEAERHLSESLAATHDLWIRQNRKVLEKSLASVKATIGEVVLVGQPTGAEVVVNGKTVGKLPLDAPLRLGEGPATVELHAAGFVTATQPVVVKAGQRKEVHVELARENVRPPSVGTAASVQPAPVRPLEPPAEALPLKKPDTESPDQGGEAPQSGSAARPAAWAMAAAATAAVGFGAYETFVWSTRKRDFDNHTRPLPDNPGKRIPDCGAADPGRGGPECDSIYQQMQTAKMLFIVGFGVGAALAAGSAILFAVSAHGDSDPNQALACVPMTTLPGAMCRLSF
jgi:hypothetical protein